MGADRVIVLSEWIDSCQGLWCFWKIIGYRAASATGVAVQVLAPAAPPAAAAGSQPITE